MRKRQSRTQRTAIVAALLYSARDAMLVTNAVAALANGYGCYDSGEGTVLFTRLPVEMNGRQGHPERSQQMGSQFCDRRGHPSDKEKQ
jgi:hypothetical protein